MASTKRSRNFSSAELQCKCGCATEHVLQSALDKLQNVRDAYGKAMVLTSAYRCSKHPAEARKAKPGQHNAGVAFDIRVHNGAEAYELMRLAFEHGATGIAMGNGFVHMDWRGGGSGIGVSWVY